MTVRLREDSIVELIGVCPIEDAEALLALLSGNPGARVDWRECEQAHAAVVQVLRAARVTPLGPPRGAFLSHLVEPELKGS
jgi:hypothetical protein